MALAARRGATTPTVNLLPPPGGSAAAASLLLSPPLASPSAGMAVRVGEEPLSSLSQAGASPSRGAG